jgi:broad specificity phosphatase PhoE
MTQRILLVRHGRSSYEHDGRWLDLEGVRRFERGYNEAGIRDDDLPPAHLIAEARAASLIVASDMPRAIASAKRLAPNCEPHISPLLREIVVEVPGWIPFRMPVEVWDTLQYWRWTYRLLRNVDHEVVRRAGHAMDWLLERAPAESTMCVVTHGMFRRVLHAQLMTRGWNAEPGPRRFANWSAWIYAREVETAASRVKLAV